MNKLMLALLLANIALSGYLLVDKLNRPKIAYIRSSELVYGYLGMQEAQREFKEKSQRWRAGSDSLQADFKLALSRYSAEAGGMSAPEKAEQEKMLQTQQQSVMDYVQATEARMKEEDRKITEGVLNQVNSFIEAYGKEQGYSIILGTTVSGSLLYGEEGIDLTDEVLEALNKNYKKG